MTTHASAWTRWQRNRVSRRHLSYEARREGHAVVRVAPAMQDVFMLVAQVIMLYGQRVQRGKPIPSHVQSALEGWEQGTRAVLALLEALPHD